MILLIVKRNLEETIPSKSNSQIKEIKEMSTIYKWFYTIANMGGLYAIIIFILGSCLRPIADKIFIHNVINEYTSDSTKAKS